MQTRFFLRIILGVLALNLYAKGQVENVAESVIPPSFTMDAGGDAQAEDETNFQQRATARDPFWPVGYAPAAPEPEAGPSAVSEAVDETGGHVDFSGLTKEEQAVIKSKMVVGGILKQGATCLAIINQQLVKEGEELSLQAADKTYRFGVKKLTPESILLESKQD